MTMTEVDDPDWDLPTDAEIAEAATLDAEERCGAPTPNGPCRLRDRHIGSDSTHYAPGGPGTEDGVPVDTSGYYVGERLGSLDGAPWVFATGGIVGAVRRNPARPAGVTILDRRAVRQQDATLRRHRARRSVEEMQRAIKQQIDAMRLS